MRKAQVRRVGIQYDISSRYFKIFQDSSSLQCSFFMNSRAGSFGVRQVPSYDVALSTARACAAAGREADVAALAIQMTGAVRRMWCLAQAHVSVAGLSKVFNYQLSVSGSNAAASSAASAASSG